MLSYKKRFDANKVFVSETGKYPYIVRMGNNNGQKGFINEDIQYLNDGNTISFGQDTATVFYQEKPYFTGDKIKILKPKYDEFCRNNAQFFITSMRRAFVNFSWGNSSFNIDVIKNINLILPSTSTGNIDFDFMEHFIAELKEERLAELRAYLKVCGLDNYELTNEEKEVIQEFDNLEFAKCDLISVFDVKNTSNILSDDIIKNSGTVPYLCASSINNAVNSYISYDNRFLERGNCIFIGGKTFIVSYQEKDFFSNDSHNLALYLKNYKRTKYNQLYLVTCLYKSLNSKYSWGNSISKKKIMSDKIYLPVKNGKINYETMDTFISAVQKLVIKDVVLYADREIETTEKIINKNVVL